MSLRIEKYNAGRLREWIESTEYHNMPIVPVSYNRALSWLKNPRMIPSDYLMYTAHEEGEMVAYRCILPDRHGETRLGWLSGNWVTTSKRRQGIASMLFEEAYRDWKGCLMYTNYAPESKAVYDKTGSFDLYAERPGMRYYFRSAAAGLLGRKSGFFRLTQPVLSLSDNLINSWQDARISTTLKKIKPELFMAEPLKGMDKELFGFLSSHNRLGFCQRDPEAFEWIRTYPWIIESGTKNKKYFFSSTASKFKNTYLKVLDKEGKMDAFLMLTRIGDKMTIPYACFSGQEPLPSIKILDHYLADRGISYFTTYNPEVESLMKNSSLPLLGKRKMTQKYFCTRELKQRLPESSGIYFQDGDGDTVFT